MSEETKKVLGDEDTFTIVATGVGVAQIIDTHLMLLHELPWGGEDNVVADGVFRNLQNMIYLAEHQDGEVDPQSALHEVLMRAKRLVALGSGGQVWQEFLTDDDRKAIELATKEAA